MKKISALFIAGLITLCFSMNLHAQSSDKPLDQQELMKQFIGTWTAENGVDSTLLWEILPYGNGYDQVLSWQAKGETFRTLKGVIGFTWQHKMVNMCYVWDNGILTQDLGKFVSEKKITLERATSDHATVVATYEMNFITPDKFDMIFKYVNVTEWTFIRVKK